MSGLQSFKAHEGVRRRQRIVAAVILAPLAPFALYVFQHLVHYRELARLKYYSFAYIWYLIAVVLAVACVIIMRLFRLPWLSGWVIGSCAFIGLCLVPWMIFGSGMAVELAQRPLWDASLQVVALCGLFAGIPASIGATYAVVAGLPWRLTAPPA